MCTGWIDGDAITGGKKKQKTGETKDTNRLAKKVKLWELCE